MGLAANRYFLPLTRALLVERDVENPLDLFRRAGIPKSPGYRALEFYVQHGAVRVHRGVHVDPRRVVALQGGLRADQAVPDRLCPSGPELANALEVLNRTNAHAAAGFQTAANLQAYYEPSGVHTLYIQRPANRAMQAARLAEISDLLSAHPDASDTNRYELHIESFDRIDVQDGPQGPMTSPVQTLLDLALHARTAAHKDFLFDRLHNAGIIDA